MWQLCLTLATTKRELWPKNLIQKNLVSFKELLMANSIQMDALAQLLIEKGVITTDEFFNKLKQVQAEHEQRKPVS